MSFEVLPYLEKETRNQSAITPSAGGSMKDHSSSDLEVQSITTIFCCKSGVSGDHCQLIRISMSLHYILRLSGGTTGLLVPSLDNVFAVSSDLDSVHYLEIKLPICKLACLPRLS